MSESTINLVETLLDFERKRNRELEAENARLRSRNNDLLESNARFEQRARDAKEAMRDAYATNPYHALSDSIRMHGRIWPIEVLMDLPREAHGVYDWRQSHTQMNRLISNLHPDSKELFGRATSERGLKVRLVQCEEAQ